MKSRDSFFIKPTVEKKETPNESNFEDDGQAYFERYMRDLGLSKEDLSKKILDVGSNTGDFANWAKQNNVSGNIFSLEPWAISNERTKSVRARAEAIPFKDNSFDFVVSDCAIPNIFLGEKDVKEKVYGSLFEMLRVTKPGGEIRLGKIVKGVLYPSQRELLLALDETLRELKEIFKVEIEEVYLPGSDHFEPAESEHAGKLLLQSYFIKIKKP
ncbi:methyltransferase domain-containing protein [Candidatus Nomurabacteria bacterium]|nr:methyltransferase domain-containing protein [Candidatus Nomurabacteria bacterium]